MIEHVIADGAAEAARSRLRRWRVDAGLTLDEVADLTGYSQSMLSLVERGQRHVSPQGKVRIARRLGVRIADLFDVEPADA